MAAGQQLERPAKPVDPEIAKEKQARAFELEVRIKQALGAQFAVEWLLAEALYEFELGDEDGPGWGWLGYESAVEFCAQPEVGMKKSKYYLYVRAWRDLVVPGLVDSERSELEDGTKVTLVPELEETSPVKVAEVLPAIVKGDVPVKQALSDAKTLGWRDLRQQYRQNDASPAPLDASQEPERCQCPTCNTWVYLEQMNGDWEIVEGTARQVTDG